MWILLYALDALDNGRAELYILCMDIKEEPMDIDRRRHEVLREALKIYNEIALEYERDGEFVAYEDVWAEAVFQAKRKLLKKHKLLKT